MSTPAPLVLDFDGSCLGMPGAEVVPLQDWQETARFGCSLAAFRRLRDHLDARMPASHGPVLMGSGDFHHLSWPLIERRHERGPFRVIVFDNHPDNMRYAFGIHCGSWVRRVARLPFVSHVHVIGITSGDVGWRHSWENYLRPLAAGKLSYWCMDVGVGWARMAGLGSAVRSFAGPEALMQAVLPMLAASREPAYVSIDKDVFSPDVARTNWDQGVLRESHLYAALDALAGTVIGSDITGEVSLYRYRAWWKRWLSAADGQQAPSAERLADWQAQQLALNARLIDRLGTASRP
ncbi:Arginase family protein [Pigmentiphaga humi]|uniref:Arginase family protein n=1 Tax=Pigmentiphaga humi TaxID=2478468 RepID=A0A3P4B2C9_9BURK|nr:arginase family protein [Pigmentiphaga humi]VCU69315.1 Arginase family protein [Pigmentiphaga humi]